MYFLQIREELSNKYLLILLRVNSHGKTHSEMFGNYKMQLIKIEIKMYLKLLCVLFLFILFLYSHALKASTGTISRSSFVVTGVVPSVVSLSTQAFSQNLDLKPGMKIMKHPIGNLHFRYNEEIAGITLASSTNSGSPENKENNSGLHSNSYSSAFTRPFKISITGACRSLDTHELSPGITLIPEGDDYKSLRSNELSSSFFHSEGIDEDCQLAASWNTKKQSSLVHGVYSMDIIITMVAL